MAKGSPVLIMTPRSLSGGSLVCGWVLLPREQSMFAVSGCCCFLYVHRT